MDRYGFLNENFRSSLCGGCACDNIAEQRHQVDNGDDDDDDENDDYYDDDDGGDDNVLVTILLNSVIRLMILFEHS